MRFRISPRVAHPQEVSVRAPPPPGCVHTDCACFRTGPRVAHPREVSVRAPPPHGCVHTDCACFRTGPRVAHPREVSVRAPPPHGCVHTDCACFRTGPRVAHPREVSVRAPPPHGCVHTDEGVKTSSRSSLAQSTHTTVRSNRFPASRQRSLRADVKCQGPQSMSESDTLPGVSGRVGALLMESMQSRG